MANNDLYIYFAYMSADKFNTKKTFSISNITILFVILYMVLFEFTWVTQTVFPKPSLLIESFLSLWSEYNLLDRFFETTAVIFPAILLTIIILEVFIKLFLTLLINYSGVQNISAPFKYFSFFFFALLLNLFFKESLLVEFIFAVIFVLGRLLQTLSDSTDSITGEYILAAKSLGLSKSQILSKVIWKDLKPNIFNKLVSIHTQTWVVIIIYEFISAVNGIGSIYKLAFNYNDLSAIMSLGIFIALVILLVNSILKMVVSKLIFWK